MTTRGMKAFALWALLCITLADPRIGSAQSAVQWDGVDRVIVFADVHGAATELRALLHETGVVDAAEHWAAGKAHVVSLGDLLDRGLQSREVMDLLMRLQDEARAAGGEVHVLLGNHEAMNLMGDLRYVDPREYATWTDLNPPGQRDDAHPSGYLGRKAAFAPAGKYGQWLLAQPVAIRINDNLFMHAGPARMLNGMSLPELNLRYRTALADTLQRPAAEGEQPLLSESGPNWYRGTALCNEAAEADVLLPLLKQFGAKRLVVGHTPTRNLRVVSRFGGQVIMLDTGMNRAAYKGMPAALLVEGANITVRYAGQPGIAQVEPENLFVTPRDLADDEVMAVLRDGAVSTPEPRGPDEFNVLVTLGGRQIPAVFQVRPAAAVRRELTALQLDRLLRLGIVPATVEREVQGKHGLLQARPRKWMTQKQVQEQAVRGGGWCEPQGQFQLIYALDTLVGNQARHGESLVWDTDDWLIYSTSFAQAFDSSRGLPGYLQARPPVAGAELRRRLATLDEKALTAVLGNLLTPAARRAILARKDALLALPAAAGAR